jgi:hypothetical protein
MFVSFGGVLEGSALGGRPVQLRAGLYSVA